MTGQQQAEGLRRRGNHLRFIALSLTMVLLTGATSPVGAPGANGTLEVELENAWKHRITIKDAVAGLEGDPTGKMRILRVLLFEYLLAPSDQKAQFRTLKSRAAAAIVLSFRNSGGTGARPIDLVNLRQARVEWNAMSISEDFSPGRGEITRFHMDASRASFALNRSSRGVLVISRGAHVTVKRWNVVVNARLSSARN